MITDVTREPGDPRSDTPRWICICPGLRLVGSSSRVKAAMDEIRAKAPDVYQGLTRIDLVIEMTGYSYSMLYSLWKTGKIQREKAFGASYLSAQEVLDHRAWSEAKAAARAEAREEKRRKALTRVVRKGHPKVERRPGTPNPSNVLLFETWSGFGSAPTEPRLGGRSYQEEYTSYV